jgi:hypothetical protein
MLSFTLVVLVLLQYGLPSNKVSTLNISTLVATFAGILHSKPRWCASATNLDKKVITHSVQKIHQCRGSHCSRELLRYTNAAGNGTFIPLGASHSSQS